MAGMTLDDIQRNEAALLLVGIVLAFLTGLLFKIAIIRRVRQFSLRDLLISVTLIAITLGIIVYLVHR